MPECGNCGTDGCPHCDPCPQKVLNDTYGKGFKDGYLAACRSFGTYRNGEQFIGTRGHNVREMAANIQEGNDDWFNEKLKEGQFRRNM